MAGSEKAKLKKEKRRQQREERELEIQPEHKRKIRNRIGLIIFLAIIIISLLSFDFYQREEFQNWDAIGTNLNTFLLINLNVLLLTAVALLFLRNLIKLIYERKKRILGFRLKSKLTLAFIVMSALPILGLYFVVDRFLTESLNFWFKGQYAVVLKNSAVVVKYFSDDWDDSLKHYAHVMVADLLKEEIPFGNQEDWFHSKLFRYRLDGIVIYDETFQPEAKWFIDEVKAEMWNPVDVQKAKEGVASSSLFFNSSLKNGQIYRALVQLKIQGVVQYLEVVRILPGSWNQNLETVRKTLRSYQNLLVLETPIRQNYSAYLWLFTLLTIFACTWFAFYLAKSVVLPIETLVKGTRRVAKGDLDFQVDLKADDEIGMLLDAFNAMTLELRQNRVKLAKSQDELIATNLALEERNIFVELVLQNIQTGVFSIDNSGYLVTINPSMINLLRLRTPRMLGKHYRSLFNKEQLQAFEGLYQKLPNFSSESIHTDVHLSINNKSLNVSMNLIPLNKPSGEPLGKLLVVEDRTELERSTRARAWSEVARRIAHEIKNPLTPIQLSAQRIRRKYLDKMEDVQLLDTCTSTIIQEVEALKNMVNEFSKFARLPEISPAPGNINIMLEEIHDFFMPGIPANIKFHLEIDPLVPNTLIDREQMKRVFTNLVDNAVASLSGQGEISLSSNYSKEYKIVIIKISDTGCGIPKSITSSVFEPYVTTKKKGTGLGLAIVHQIVTDHGGFIRFEENDPIGTICVLELPA